MHPAVSIIIPARNDAEALRLTLDHLERLPGIQDAEIIVAASGDREATESAVAFRAKTVWPAQSTRAALMNSGASLAAGEIFFFLHADSFPPPEAITEIHAALENQKVVG